MVNSRGAWLVLGVAAGFVVGLNLAGVWPQVSVQASATHGQENFAMCTGTIDPEVEAVYLLDFVTGDLKAAVLSINTRMFNTFYTYNVSKDFGAVKNPKYLMVSGNADMRRQLAVPVGEGVIYIAEMSSGQLAAYGLPWNPGRQSSNATVTTTFLPLDKFKFRTTAIRGGAAE
jgi:hypothetical protein